VRVCEREDSICTIRIWSKYIKMYYYNDGDDIREKNGLPYY